MAAGNFTVYGAAMESIADGTIDLDNDTFVMVLVTSGYTPAVDTHSTWADVSANEASGTGYTAGGQVVSPLTVTRATNVVTVDCGNTSWANSTITAKYAVIVRRAGGSLAGTDLLLLYLDLDTGGGSVSSANATFDVNTPNGLFTLTRS